MNTSYKNPRWLKLRLLAALLPTVALAAPPTPTADSFLRQNCIACHNSTKPQAGLDLSKLAYEPANRDNFATWVKVHDRVAAGEMPPKGMPRPAAAAMTPFLKQLATTLTQSETATTAKVGRSGLRRLNAYEYENSIRDLLAVPWLRIKDQLPQDGIAHRFNKTGSALDVSHVQMARYLDTAEQALRDVIAAQTSQPQTNRYYARDQRRMINRMRYSPFNTSPERAMIPIFGFDTQRDVVSDSVPLTVGPNHPDLRDLEGYATPAGTFNGNDYSWDQFKAHAGGRYKLRLNAFSIWIGTEYGPLNSKTRPPWWRPSRKHTEKGRNNEPLSLYALRPGGEKRYLTTIDLTPEPTVHEVEVDLLEGDSISPDAARLFRSRPGWVGSSHASKEGMPGVAYRWMETVGPTPVRTPQLIPAKAADAPSYLRNFLTRALNRPHTEAEFQSALRIVNARLGKNQSNLKEAMIAGYTAILCSPGFLYLDESPGPLSATALAARLSYFLTNSAPDTELRRLAANGTLKQPAILRAQTERLLNSPRAKQSFDAFLDFWLDLRKVNDNTPDVILYPEYYLDDLLTESAEKQTRRFYAHLVENNLPAANLVQSDFTFLNSHLANHYKLPPVEGSALRKVTLPAGSPRGGLLTNASILKLTANGTTTSPVLRGTWIMERIVGMPPPPPPPGVGSVEPDTRGATTIREQLDKHRNNPGCAGCHRKIDPPGFALESFDIFGGQRTHYRSTEEGTPAQGLGKNGHAFTFKLAKPVDSSGEFFGQPFRDISEFQSILAKDDRQLARNIASQLIIYATGAPVSFSTRDKLEAILNQAQRDKYGLRTLIHQIVQSDFFTRK